MNYKKRRIELYSFYDHTGIKKHLQEMAKKGWMIERISNLGWKYRKIPPADLNFAIAYCPKISEYDPEPTPDQQDFLDFCAHTGWHPVCTWAQMQIFYHEHKDATPIETEPILELETIHKTAKNRFLPAYGILFVLALFQIFLLVFGLPDNLIDLLASTSSLCSCFAWMMLLLTCTAEITGYLRWYKKAKKAAEYGEFLNVKGHLWLSRIICAATVLDGIYWIISLYALKDRLLFWYGLLALSYVVVLIISGNAVRQFLKRKKAARIVNRTLTIAACYFLTFAFTGCIIYLAVSNVFPHSENLRQYAYDFPLTLEDLDNNVSDPYITKKLGSASLLLESATFFQYPAPSRPDSYDPSDKELIYTITTIRLPVLYPLCRKVLLQEMEETFDAGIPQGQQNEYQKQDPSLWNAQEVYRLVNQGTGPFHNYLICYPGRIIKLHFSWEPTDTQITAAARKLMPGS